MAPIVSRIENFDLDSFASDLDPGLCKILNRLKCYREAEASDT